MDNLYIPNKLKVGFQKRQDTFTKKLAYVIYYDDKGKLRKEASWSSWRDDKIPAEEYENVPTSGFMINKNVERYNWSHFSNNRSYIRIHDPRGFEFEVTPENLIGILMSGDCTHRLLDGEFVYGWHGTNLVLLPVNTEEYKKSMSFTALQSKKVSTKDLTPGFTYKTKKQLEELVYLGRFDWCENSYSGSTRGLKITKQYVFAKSLGKDDYNYRTQKCGGVDIVKMAGLAGLGEVVSTVQHPKLADFMDTFNSMPEANAKYGWKFKPRSQKAFSEEIEKFSSPYSTCVGFLVQGETPISVVYVRIPQNSYGDSTKNTGTFVVDYVPVTVSENGILHGSPQYCYYYNTKNVLTKDQVLGLNVHEIVISLKNGKSKTFVEVPYDFRRE